MRKSSRRDRFERELEQDKAVDAALIVNPELRSLFEEVKKKEKTASCSELKEMLEKVRMLIDNKEWEDEPEWMAINRLFAHLLKVFKNRCHEMWKEYAGKLSRKYVKEMEEAWYWRQVEPLKE
jgi:glutamyl-tRNA reductase